MWGMSCKAAWLCNSRDSWQGFYKIALELLCCDAGADFVLGARLEEVRRVILGQSKCDGYLLLPSKMTPKLEVGALLELELLRPNVARGAARARFALEVDGGGTRARAGVDHR